MPTPRFPALVAAWSCAFSCFAAASGAAPATSSPPGAKDATATAVAVTRQEDRVRVEIGGRLFTEYHFGPKETRPYFYPVIATDGTGLTRNYPMQNPGPPDEEHDHPHHRGLWYAHGDINGVDFWLDKPTSGRIVQSAILEAEGGPRSGVLRTRSEWVAPAPVGAATGAGEVVCVDERTMRFSSLPHGRVIDFTITLHAGKTPMLIGDTKEGTMAFRLNEAMRLTRKVDKKNVPGAGHIVTAAGKRDKEAWGTRAAWCDYFAPVGAKGAVLGVTIMDHPKNPRYPTYWMVRDYGMFNANPFGVHEFEKLDDKRAGDLTVPAGGSVTFRYRYYFHTGDTAAAEVAAVSDAFAATP